VKIEEVSVAHTRSHTDGRTRSPRKAVFLVCKKRLKRSLDYAEIVFIGYPHWYRKSACSVTTNFKPSPSITTMIKSRTVKLVGHTARMRQKYMLLDGKSVRQMPRKRL